MIAGTSLVERVYQRAIRSKQARAVYVATDDDRIYDHVRSFGGRVVRTPADAASGTDRIAMAVGEIEGREGLEFERIVNIQGDEPLVDMHSVDRMITTLRDEPVDIVTLACAITSEEDFQSPDVVKVVVDKWGQALYFSRSPIPHGGGAKARRHVGLYGFQAEALRGFAALPPTVLESAERLEQLRALENGYRIRVLETSAPHLGVDRPEDVARVERELARLRSKSSEE